MSIFRLCQRHLHNSAPSLLSRKHSTSAKSFNVTLDGQTLYVPKELAEALGWASGLSTEGVALRLGGWDPNYFVITQVGTDADLLARSTIESSRNPNVIHVLEYLKKSDSE